jgi:hypothetical protein
MVIVLCLYYLSLSFGHYIVSALLMSSVWSLYCLCSTYAFVWPLYCLCPTYGFRLVIVLSLFYLRLSFGHGIVSLLLTLSLGPCIVSVLLMYLVWSLYCLCTTYGFRLVIVLSLFYLRISFGHCIVSVLLTAYVWSLYCHCTTYGFHLSLYCLCTTYSFRLVIALSLYYLRL